MNCLLCSKELPLRDEACGWHKKCIQKFFGTSSLPEMHLDEDTLRRMVEENIKFGNTVTGVQKKLSLHLFSERKNPRLTIMDYPTGYIFKPQVDAFETLPEAEHLTMSMAENVGIKTVPHALIKTENGYGYITKRIDRISLNNKISKLAMEDFCQLDLRLTQDKYKGSYERCAKVIDRFSYLKGLDKAELYVRILFSFIVGNSDMHLKNFSLIENQTGSGQYTLSPAYDLVPVNVIMPEDKEQFALPMNGKKTNIRKKDFIVFAQQCDISKVSAEKMMHDLVGKEQLLVKMCNCSLLSNRLKESFSTLIQERIDLLK